MSKQSKNFILKNYKTMSIADMAAQTKRTYWQMYSHMQKWGLIKEYKKEHNISTPDGGRRDYNKWPYSTIINQYIEGWYLEDIAKNVNIPEWTCVQIIEGLFGKGCNLNHNFNAKYEIDSYTKKKQIEDWRYEYCQDCISFDCENCIAGKNKIISKAEQKKRFYE